jgi:hypothetical protein
VSADATAARHGLGVVRRLRGGYGTRWIAEVESPEHGRCVLKAIRPRPAVDGDELAALRTWTATRARLPARLLAEPEPGVALLEWIDGPLVAERGALATDEAHAIGAALRDLHQPLTDGQVLLHGDLNARNLIVSPAGIRCIDPLGIVGEPVHDLVSVAASNPAADRRATFAAACEGYGLDPLEHGDRLLMGFRDWIALIERRGGHELHPVDDLVDLLEGMPT